MKKGHLIVTTFMFGTLLTFGQVNCAFMNQGAEGTRSRTNSYGAKSSC